MIKKEIGSVNCGREAQIVRHFEKVFFLGVLDDCTLETNVGDKG